MTGSGTESSGRNGRTTDSVSYTHLDVYKRQVHERGGEILDLPRGTRIYPHDVSMRMAKGGQSQMINIPKLADQIIVREEADIDRIGDRLVQKIRKSSENRGGYSYAADMA